MWLYLFFLENLFFSAGSMMTTGWACTLLAHFWQTCPPGVGWMGHLSTPAWLHWLNKLQSLEKTMSECNTWILENGTTELPTNCTAMCVKSRHWLIICKPCDLCTILNIKKWHLLHSCFYQVNIHSRHTMSKVWSVCMWMQLLHSNSDSRVSIIYQ